jgi:hypothetical protein
MLERVKVMAPDHPEWNDIEPFSSLLSGKRFATGNFSFNGIMQIYAATSSNLTPEEYMSMARDWLYKSNCEPRALRYT